MLTIFMKWISAGASAALLLSNSFPRFGFALTFIVFGGASAVALQASRADRYMWAGTFVLIALLFNPVVPVALPFSLSVGVYVSCLAMFLWSLRLKTSPTMTIASITKAGAASYSL